MRTWNKKLQKPKSEANQNLYIRIKDEILIDKIIYSHCRLEDELFFKKQDGSIGIFWVETFNSAF